ncbi:MAG: hypothetical protein JOZ54_00875 [Acidobacteria bacterium]|nr:hypothetical protein [Acidobacteriota bacterium]
MTNLLIRNVDPKLVERLKARAAGNRRSLQAELQAIIENAASFDMEKARRTAERIREQLAGRKQSDSAKLIREDRDR